MLFLVLRQVSDLICLFVFQFWKDFQRTTLIGPNLLIEFVAIVINYQFRNHQVQVEPKRSIKATKKKTMWVTQYGWQWCHQKWNRWQINRSTWNSLGQSGRSKYMRGLTERSDRLKVDGHDESIKLDGPIDRKWKVCKTLISDRTGWIVHF